MNVHELVRKQVALLVVEDGLQFVRSGRGIDLVVDGQQFPGRDLGRVVAVIRFDRQRSPVAVQLAHHLRKLILRQSKNHGDRLQLRDHQQPVRIRRVNDVAHVDQPQPDASANRRGDMRIH